MTLFVLAGATLVPASAVAMDDNNGGLGCQPAFGLPSGFGINANGFCVLEVPGGGSTKDPFGVGYGGGATPPAAPKSVPWRPSTQINITSNSLAHCIVWPEHCDFKEVMPGSRGPLWGKAAESGRGRHETARGNPSRGRGGKPKDPPPPPKRNDPACADIAKWLPLHTQKLQRFQRRLAVTFKRLHEAEEKAAKYDNELAEIAQDDVDMLNNELDRVKELVKDASDEVQEDKDRWKQENCDLPAKVEAGQPS